MSEASEKHTNCYCEKCYPFVARSAYDEIFKANLELSKKVVDLNKQIKNLNDLVGCMQVEIDDLRKQ